MRIIIVQAEIEAAIRAYVLSQITVAPGQEVSIDFKNTRGDDGATAEITIGVPVVQTPAPKKVTRTSTATLPIVEQEAAVEQTESTQVESSTETNEAPDEVQEGPQTTVAKDEPADQQADTTAEEGVNEVAPERPSGSLFAGLKRPNNS